jgi:hypothetical protein
MTPTQIELHNAHLARKQRIADAAARLNPKTDCEFSIAIPQRVMFPVIRLEELTF